MIDDINNEFGMTKKETALNCILIFVFSMLLFLTANYNLEFIKIDTRWALFVRYMFKDGINFYPTIFHHPYPDYPGIFTILSYWLSSWLDTVNMFTVTFPTSIAAGITVVFTYLTGLYHSRKQALYAVIILLATVKFFECARGPNPDFFIAAVTAISFYFVYRSLLSSGHKISRTYMWIVPLCLLIGFFFRGPIGLVIPAGVVCMTFLFGKRFKAFFAMGFSAVLILILAVIFSYYLAYLQAGPAFAHDVLMAQALGRFGSSDPFYYYFLASFGSYAIAYPITILTIIFMWKKFIRSNDKNDGFYILKFLFIWAFIIFLGLSIPGSKQDRYLLSAAPALALIASFFFNEKYISNKIHKLIVALLNFLLLCAPLILFTGLWTGLIIVKIFRIPINYPVLQPAILLTVLSILVYTMLYVCRLKSSQFMKLLIGLLSFFIFSIAFLQPINLQYESSLKFVNTVQKLRNNNRPLVFFRLGPDGDELKYIVNIRKMFTPEYISTPEDFIKYRKPYIIILKSSKYKLIPRNIEEQLHILAKGKLGHVDCMAVQLEYFKP